MALIAGFFDSVNGDRKYNARDFGKLFEGVIRDGVFEHIGEAFRVYTANSATSVRVGPGKAWIKTFWVVNDSTMQTSIGTGPASGLRKTALCIKIDDSTGARRASFEYINGPVHATTPLNPTIPSDTASVFYRPLAYITRRGTAIVEPRDIEIMVGRDSTPYVTAPLQSIDVSTHLTRFENDFDSRLSRLETLAQNRVDSLTSSSVARLEALFDSLAAQAASANATAARVALLEQSFATMISDGIIKTAGEFSNGPFEVNPTSGGNSGNVTLEFAIPIVSA